MATESMMREAARWAVWRNQFEGDVDDYCPDPTHDPINWTDARGYFRDGFTTRDAARMYCESHHIGVNS